MVSGARVDIKPGNAMPLARHPGRHDRAQYRAEAGRRRQDRRAPPGTYAQLVGKDAGYAQIKLHVGRVARRARRMHGHDRRRSNADNMNQHIGKAGRNRWLGRRPHNRGVVMNPVDHPHGGGEGRTSGGRHPVTPWGKPTKGYKTRVNKRTDKLIIRRASKGK